MSRDISIAKMKNILRAANVILAGDDGMPGLHLNLRGTFGDNDNESITQNEIPVVYALWRAFGEWSGLVWWVWHRRGQEPISTVRDEILRRFGIEKQYSTYD